MSTAGDRMRQAPHGPEVEVTAEYTTYSIQHRHPATKDYPATDRWFTSWAGERHRSDDPEQAKQHRLEVDKTYDRAYSGDSHWAESRILRKVERRSVVVEAIPAVWEAAS